MPELQTDDCEADADTDADVQDSRGWRLSGWKQRMLLTLILAFSAVIVLGTLRVAKSVHALLGGGASLDEKFLMVVGGE